MAKTMNNLFAEVRKIIVSGIVCMLFLTAVSCDASKEHYADDEISFTRFSLSGNCHWIVPGWEDAEWWKTPDRVFIINNREELRRHVRCVGGGLPNIDFSRYTLLLASGTTSTLGSVTTYSFEQLSANKYKLNVEVSLSGWTMLGRWTIGLITNKLARQSKIELNVTYISHID